ncbi:hypothetical protein, partial [Streptomyces cadmiisoli]|uniref:hypothetical protein n=1 Tax=Streptomyces cadmiisoli TaxID=2184053 RepID=UPI003D73E5BB
MNTERPENDDVAGGTGAAGTTGAGRDATEAGGATSTPQPTQTPRAGEAAGTGEAAGAAGAGETPGAAGTPETPDAAEAAGAGETRGVAEPAETPGAVEAAGTAGAGETPGAAETAETAETPDAPDAGRTPETAGTSGTPEPASTPDAPEAALTPEPASTPGAVRAAGTPASVGEAAGAPAADGAHDGAPGSGRRRTPVVVASVAAAVLLVGGGGAYLAASAGGGAGTGSGAPAAGGTPPPLALDGYSEDGGKGIAPGEPDPNGVVYRATRTLPDGPDSAAVHRPAGKVTEADVVRLARALGLEGTPVAEGQAWRLGGGDGQGPGLQVNQRAPGTWTFNRYVPGTDNCRSTTVCAEKPASGRTEAHPVSEGEAKKAAAPVLKAVGQDDAKVDAGQVMGAQRVVNAAPEVGGLPTYGWSTAVTVGAGGEVVAGSGQLKAPEKGDTYPVVSAAEALKLMNAAQAPGPRPGIGGCADPVPLEDEPTVSCERAPLASRAVPATEPIEVEDAVFGLASHHVQARQMLVPSWLFEVRAPGAKDGFTVTYPAIEPEYLASPAPSGQPSPRPTGPGDRPTSAPDTRDVRVEGYTAQGRELTVSFTGGVCADYEAKAEESADRVTVTVTVTAWKDKVCILIAKVYHRTVQLDRPLGDRKVVGADNRGVPLEKP